MSNENEMKQKLIQMAFKLYKEKGYKNVSIADICGALGVTRNTYYYYFKSKEEIFDYYRNAPETIVGDNLANILQFSSAYEQLTTIFDIFLRDMVQMGPELTGLILKRNIDKPLYMYSPDDLAMGDVYITLIKKAQEKKEILNPSSPEDLLAAVTYLSNGVASSWCNTNGGFDFVKHCRHMIDVLLIANSKITG